MGFDLISRCLRENYCAAQSEIHQRILHCFRIRMMRKLQITAREKSLFFVSFFNLKTFNKLSSETNNRQCTPQYAINRL